MVRDHRPAYARECPALFADALRAAKSTSDPQGILNSGVLIYPQGRDVGVRGTMAGVSLMVRRATSGPKPPSVSNRLINQPGGRLQTLTRPSFSAFAGIPDCSANAQKRRPVTPGGG